MSTVYKFRVTFEDYDEVSRDIEIKSTQTFEDLHYNIQSSIGFDAKKPASFYMSNDNWIRGQEISLEERTNKEGEKSKLMSQAKLSNFIADPHQKILYHSDYDSSWTFRVELVKILPQADGMRNYPVCVKTVGEAPKQYQVVALPKSVVAEEDELEKLLGGGIAASMLASAAVAEEDEEEDEKADSMIDTEDGVDDDELEGMGEEGEDEEESEDGENEMGFADGEEDQKEDF